MCILMKQESQLMGDTGWIWAATTNNSCFITIENSRGRNVLEKHFDSFAGVAICDGWRPYEIFDKRQRCWAHILREAKYCSNKLETDNSVSVCFSARIICRYYTTQDRKTKLYHVLLLYRITESNYCTI